MCRDNWETLVAPLLQREQLWLMFHDHSRTPTITSIASSDFSGHILNFSRNSLKPMPVSPPPPVLLTNPSGSQVGNNASGSIRGASTLFAAPATLLAWYRSRKLKHRRFVSVPEIHIGQLRRFSLRELEVATDSFSEENVIGNGYSKVYKGRLADGSLVAVKRPKHRRAQGAELQFQTEVEMIGIAVHPNVLRVRGFCITPKEWLLVYPLMVNGSVASCLRERPESQSPLDWPIRKRIALGAARGLAYLHDECDRKIIHRDVKAANILLDENFEAVVGDLGLAILMDHKDTHVTTSIPEKIRHIAPEYLFSARFSEKTDVFSYGLFILELIMGKKVLDLSWLALDEQVGLLDWVQRITEEKKWETLVDADCGGNHMKEVVEQLMQIALLCTQNYPEGRPKMSEIVGMLEGGDGLAESWEEWHKKEMFQEKLSYTSLHYIVADDTFNMPPDELSGPR
ncbi:hypothetical protein Pfo_026882 [Paulownia fortunei]|nr:hypothetical protein Pfo_026882 [Paulownia fortunei]